MYVRQAVELRVLLLFLLLLNVIAGSVLNIVALRTVRVIKITATVQVRTRIRKVHLYSTLNDKWIVANVLNAGHD